ncbi:shikimate dehydrogenase [Rhodovulum sp. DZ06]|uniref:shikimate dehydrogenase n=1 Tax=Rhodovulum sp. DZ06 TaxID=3425126 RepID=UPI003D34692A
MSTDQQGPGAPESAEPRALRVGLIGAGIQGSRTPAMHRAEGAAQGIALRYDLLDTDLMDPPGPAIGALLDRAEAEGYAGLNITFPYKKAVMAELDALSEGARRVGAVNTVVFRDGRRFGHNTDRWGFAEGLARGLPGAGMGCVLLLGAGGAGGAVAHALVGAGAERLLIADMSAEAAAALAASINAHDPGRAEVAPDLAAAAAQADGIVNATPMGMAKLPGAAIDLSLLDPRHWVADIVYFPLETALLAAARARGCRTLSGAGMAVFQAVRAFELFTGKTPDAARMRATFESMGA